MRSGRILLAAAGFVYALFAAGCFRLAVEHGYERAVSEGEGSFVLLGAAGFFVAASRSWRAAAVTLATLPLVGWFLATPWNPGPPFLFASLVAPCIACVAFSPQRPRAHAADVAAVIRRCLSEKNGAEAAPGLQGRRASCRLEDPDAPRVRRGNTEGTPAWHPRRRAVTRLRTIPSPCETFVAAASGFFPRFPLRRSMVRRGSTVRVRQRASQKASKSRFLLP
jgi:hypothetical protein